MEDENASQHVNGIFADGGEGKGINASLHHTLALVREGSVEEEPWSATIERMRAMREEIRGFPMRDGEDLRLLIGYLLFHSRSLRSLVSKTALETLNEVLRAFADVAPSGLFDECDREENHDSSSSSSSEEEDQVPPLLTNMISLLTLKASMNEKKFISDAAEACLASFIQLIEAQSHAGYVLNKLLLARAVSSKSVKEIAIAVKYASKFVEKLSVDNSRGTGEATNVRLSDADLSVVISTCTSLREGKSVEARKHAIAILQACEAGSSTSAQ